MSTADESASTQEVIAEIYEKIPAWRARGISNGQIVGGLIAASAQLGHPAAIVAALRAVANNLEQQMRDAGIPD